MPVRILRRVAQVKTRNRIFRLSRLGVPDCLGDFRRAENVQSVEMEQTTDFFRVPLAQRRHTELDRPFFQAEEAVERQPLDRLRRQEKSRFGLPLLRAVKTGFDPPLGRAVRVHRVHVERVISAGPRHLRGQVPAFPRNEDRERLGLVQGHAPDHRVRRSGSFTRSVNGPEDALFVSGFRHIAGLVRGEFLEQIFLGKNRFAALLHADKIRTGAKRQNEQKAKRPNQTAGKSGKHDFSPAKNFQGGTISFDRFVV